MVLGSWRAGNGTYPIQSFCADYINVTRGNVTGLFVKLLLSLKIAQSLAWAFRAACGGAAPFLDAELPV